MRGGKGGGGGEQNAFWSRILYVMEFWADSRVDWLGWDWEYIRVREGAFVNQM